MHLRAESGALALSRQLSKVGSATVTWIMKNIQTVLASQPGSFRAWPRAGPPYRTSTSNQPTFAQHVALIRWYLSMSRWPFPWPQRKTFTPEAEDMKDMPLTLLSAQGGAEISSKMCNISNSHGRARKARLGNLRSKGYEMGLAKGRGFSAKRSAGTSESAACCRRKTGHSKKVRYRHGR